MTARHGKPLPSLHESLELHTRTAVLVTEGRVGGLAIRRANAAFAAMVDVPLDELIGRSLLSLTGPATDFDVLRATQAELDTGRAALAEIAIHRSDGSPIWIEADFAPLGDTGHFVVVARDITTRRAAAEELRRAGEVLDLATAAGRVGIWEWEPEADHVVWNATLRELLGVTSDAPASVDAWTRIIHPDDLDLALGHMERRYADGEARYRLIHQGDGSVIHAVINAHMVAGRLVGTIVDVTEIQHAADRVTETLESITDAHYALDREWRFTYINRHAERLLFRRRDELLGTCLWDEFPDAAGSSFDTNYRIAVAEQRPVEFEAYYEPLEDWFEVRAYPVSDGIAVYFRDIGDRRAERQEREQLLAREQRARQAAEAAKIALQHQAAHDALTDLANRTQLLEHLGVALDAGEPVTVLFIDLDRFKLVNDSLGHAAGDAVLRAVARRLSALVRGGDVVARIGGDEFVVGLVGSSPAVVDRVAARILQAVSAPIGIEGQDLVMSASIGISQAVSGADADSLVRDADVALYRAKDGGRDQAVWFDARARQDVLERVRIEQDLRHALAREELDLHYQPAFDLRTGRMLGVEALLRWAHPDREDVGPAEFIPVAEESGLILPIGDWVLATATAAACAWEGDGAFTAWANVSARQLARPGLAATIQRHLQATGLAPESFGIEITESVLGDSATVRRELTAICELGVRVAIDDFGTGFSSIGRLRDLPVDVLKIDRSFVWGMSDSGGVETVAAIVHLGHALGRTVLAEGVETSEQLASLRAVGCDAVAGFLLARPVPASDVVAAAERGTALLVASA